LLDSLDSLDSIRKALALRLKEHINNRQARATTSGDRRLLDDAGGPFELRTPGRLRVQTREEHLTCMGCHTALAVTAIALHITGNSDEAIAFATKNGMSNARKNASVVQPSSAQSMRGASAAPTATYERCQSVYGGWRSVT
jgi:hypothetical protein